MRINVNFVFYSILLSLVHFFFLGIHTPPPLESVFLEAKMDKPGNALLCVCLCVYVYSYNRSVCG